MIPPVARTEFPSKATHAQTRAHNAALVLRALYDLGPISRADIARLTGLTRTSVGELVADLERDGLAEDVGRGPSTGGKQPTLVALKDDARSVITLDLGERTFTAALANLRGELTTKRTRDLEGRDGEQAVQLVHELIDDVRREATSPLLGIGVGTPGMVDADGTIRWAVNLDWQDLPLARILEERHGLPAVVANDSRAAALATYLFGGDERPQNLVVIKVGRGIGAGIILRDQLFGGDGEAPARSATSSSTPTASNAIAGASAASRPWPASRPSSAPRAPTTFEELVDRTTAGDDRVLPVVLAAGRAIGAAIAGLTGALDVRHITIVGSATALGEPWFDAIRDEAGRRSLGTLARETRIVDGGTGEDVTLLGACALLLTRELGLTVHR